MMKFAVIVSKKDPAGMNIKKFLDDVIVIDDETIFAENIDKEVDADILIFATKHQAKSGVASLSVHTPGNWGEAKFGGKDGEVCVAPANLLKKAMKLLENKKLEGFEVILECTHHGPFVSKPCMFIEIGSSENEWIREDAGKVIADVIKEIISTEVKGYKSAVGIGGLHHTPNFKKIILKSDIAISHVCPKYSLKSLDVVKLRKAMERTVPKSELVIVDWKGLGEHKQKVVDILEELDVDWKKTKDF
ncbi:hypothetical protein GOV08_03830 [Candidatus Woesearchaeota archaeon]|nr:hypothetical protein [Candidatus Woesearchaeota archaeon]